MKDWVSFLTAIIQLVTAIMLYSVGRKEKKKGTKRRPGGKRK